MATQSPSSPEGCQNPSLLPAKESRSPVTERASPTSFAIPRQIDRRFSPVHIIPIRAGPCIEAGRTSTPISHLKERRKDVEREELKKILAGYSVVGLLAAGGVALTAQPAMSA